MRSRADVLRLVEGMEEIASRLRGVHARRVALGAERSAEIERQIEQTEHAARVIRSEVAIVPEGDAYYARREWDATATGNALTRQYLQRVEDETDRSEAGNALPRVLPRAIVDSLERLAADAEKSPSAMLEQATRTWKAAGAPRVNVPAAVEAAAAALSAGAAAYVRVLYQAAAWWLLSLGLAHADDPSPRG